MKSTSSIEIEYLRANYYNWHQYQSLIQQYRRNLQVCFKTSIKNRCEFCNKDFASFKGVQQHIGKIHEMRPRDVRCEVCLKAFKHKHALKFHKIQVHDKSTRVSCEKCKKQFYNKYLLASHGIACVAKIELDGEIIEAPSS